MRRAWREKEVDTVTWDNWFPGQTLVQAQGKDVGLLATQGKRMAGDAWGDCVFTGTLAGWTSRDVSGHPEHFFVNWAIKNDQGDWTVSRMKYGIKTLDKRIKRTDTLL